MFFVAFNNIRSLYNVGSMFRTADAFGVNRIILGGYTGFPPRKEITKTALGAEEWIPFERKFHLAKALLALKDEGFSCVALENNVSPCVSLSSFVPSFPLVLVVGNEVHGVSKSVQKLVDITVSIPMEGRKESLNVAVAFGIAAYAISQRRVK